MPSVRDFRERDLGRVVELWEQEGAVPVGPDGLSVDEAMDLMASSEVQVLVAEQRDEIVGVAVGAVNGPVGTVFRSGLWDELKGWRPEAADRTEGLAALGAGRTRGPPWGITATCDRAVRSSRYR